jgi:hypothetical protein
VKDLPVQMRKSLTWDPGPIQGDRT